MSNTPFLFVPTFSWPEAPFGLLYTYIAGSSTPKTTYSDAAGLIPLTNPVELDATGSATIRLGSGSYKFVLLDQTNTVTIWTQDDYDPVGFNGINSDVLPEITNTNNIGSPSLIWANGYFGTVWTNGAPAVSYPETLFEIAAPVTVQDLTKVPDGTAWMNVFRFFTAGQQAAVLAGSNTVDVSAAVQAANNFLEGTAIGSIASLGSFVAGSGYTPGTYTNVGLTGGHGVYASATIVVGGGGTVSSVVLVTPGQSYHVGDSLGCSSLGAGSSFAVPVASLQSGGKTAQQGGMLYFPSGYYYFGTATPRVGGNVRWIGSQSTATSFNWSNAYTGNGIQFGPDQSGFYGFSGYYTAQSSMEQFLINLSPNQAYGIYSTGLQQGTYFGHLIINNLGATAVGMFLQDHKGSAYTRAYDIEIIGSLTCSSAATMGIVVDGPAVTQLDQISVNGSGTGALRLLAGIRVLSGGCTVTNMDAEFAVTAIDLPNNTSAEDFLSVNGLSQSSAVGVWIHSGYVGSVSLLNVNGSNPNVMVQNDVTGEAATFATQGNLNLYVFSASTNIPSYINNVITAAPVAAVNPGGGSITFQVNLNSAFNVTATTNTAFTVQPPQISSNAMPATGRTGQRILITIRNTSGGAMGAITWNAVFKLSTFTNPANGNSRSIEFEWNGTNWIMLWQTAADVPN